MSEYTKKAMVRINKLFHYLLTICSFAGCYLFFYGKWNRSTFVAIIIYSVIVLFSLRTYNAYQIGLSRIRMLVYSQTLADIVAAGIIYILMALERFAFLNPLPFLGLLTVQFLLNFIWSFAANTIYFRLYKPRKTAIVYRKESDLHRLEEIYKYNRKFRVEKMIEDPSDDIHALISELEGFEAVFVTGVSATLRNGIEKFCVEQDVRCYIMPHVGDVMMMGAEYLELFSVPVFRVMRASPRIEYMVIKRGIDLICSLLGIVILSPFMLITALAVKLYDGGPVIYKQVRLTKDGRQFNIFKFRSMRVNAEGDGVARLAATNDDRITPVGKVIRACRLDELPQLFNILRGDMSIVGPRPERPEIAQQYEQMMPSFSLRLQVKAGLTGLAQVYGKYNTDPYDKLRMDLMYINQMSLLEDIKLMFATVKVLFMKESTSGISQGQTTAAAEQETMEYEMKVGGYAHESRTDSGASDCGKDGPRRY
ncbi:MAG: sugar transferase [Eubacteriales bacterium]